MFFGPFKVSSIPSIVLGNGKAKSASPGVALQKRAVLYLSLLTVVLWATSGYTTQIFGNLGIISLMFMSIMFGSGMLTEVDLNSFSWHTLCLLGGSNVLGQICEGKALPMALTDAPASLLRAKIAVSPAGSGLLDHLVDGILETLSPNVYMSAAYVFGASCIIATLVSHTVRSGSRTAPSLSSE